MCGSHNLVLFGGQQKLVNVSNVPLNNLAIDLWDGKKGTAALLYNSLSSHFQFS